MIRRKYVPLRIVQPGMMIDQAIIDRAGRVLIARRTRLEDFHIDALKKMGVTGIYTCELFLTQLRAALRASAYGPLQIMFPMVGSLEDIRKAKEYLNLAKEQLKERKQQFDEQIRIGIMIEIPAIALIADLAAEEVDFASIGSNDLTQYLSVKPLVSHR